MRWKDWSRHPAVAWAPAVLGVLLWSGLGWAFARVPSPLTVAGEVWALLGEGEAWRSYASTLARTLVSFVVAAVGGVSVGVALGSIREWGRGIEAVVDFLRSIPGPALLPVFIVAFGIYNGPKIALAVAVCVLINITYTTYGVRAEWRALRTEWFTAVGAKWHRVLRMSVLPGAVLQISAGLRITLSLALVLSTLAEYVLMTGSGAGALIRISYEDDRVARMYAYIILLGVVGYGLNVCFVLTERKLRDWREPGSHGQMERLPGLVID